MLFAFGPRLKKVGATDNTFEAASNSETEVH